jgi:hypothetical protein
VFVITDASGTFNEVTRHSAWLRMQAAGVQLMNWLAMACGLHRDWRNDIEGLSTLFSNHIPNLPKPHDELFYIGGQEVTCPTGRSSRPAAPLHGLPAVKLWLRAQNSVFAHEHGS